MSDRDIELVRYAIQAAEIKQQDEAWEVFNKLVERLAEAERLLSHRWLLIVADEKWQDRRDAFLAQTKRAP